MAGPDVVLRGVESMRDQVHSTVQEKDGPHSFIITQLRVHCQSGWH